MCRQAELVCRRGATDVELAGVYGVTASTLNLWKKRHPEFSESIKRGKVIADALVAEALYRRGMGYSHPAVKIMQYEGAPVVVPYIEHYPPDTAACIFWLKNRRPASWA